MARDRLAAIRALQAANDSNQRQEQPSAPRQRGQDRREPRDFDPREGAQTGQGGRAAAQQQYDQQQQPQAGFYQPTQGYDNRTRPNVDYQAGTYSPEQIPRQDFNPNQFETNRGGGGGANFSQYSPSTQPQRSQYQPQDPQRTRQRSLSGGQRTYEDRAAVQQAQQGRYAPPIPNNPSAAGYEYEDKGSTVNLVENEYELEQRRPSAGNNKSSSGAGKLQKKGGKTIKKGDVEFEEMGEFFAEISDLQQSLRQANGNIQQIESLHSRILSLPSAEDPQSIQLTSQLAEMTQQTRSFYNQIKNRIQNLEQGNANLSALIPLGQTVYGLSLADVQVRQTQVSALKEKFKEAIQRYAQVERDNRAKQRQRMERQVKIVNPTLSQFQVQDVVRQAEEGGNNSMFSQALLTSNGQRTYAARGAMREVETRAAELKRIEQTLVELAQLFNDMAVLVEAQDVQVVAVESSAVQANTDMEKGLDSTKKAVVSARNARKWRWICFSIILIIIIIVVIVVVVEIVIPQINKRNARNNNQQQPANPAAAANTAQLVNSVVANTIAQAPGVATAAAVVSTAPA